MDLKIVIALVCVGVILLGGYMMGLFTPAKQAPQEARDACRALCMERLAAGDDLSSGPCLSNAISAGWVCDVAHSPRQGVDNIAANQCSEFGKTASHFVEVDPQCAVIKEV